MWGSSLESMVDESLVTEARSSRCSPLVNGFDQYEEE